MAIAGTLIALGAGAGITAATIRAGLVGFLSVDWTVGAVVTFNVALTNEYSCFTCTHTSGVQILFHMCEGSAADASNTIVDATNRMIPLIYSTFQDGMLLLACDAGTGTATFNDKIYTDGIGPSNGAFFDDLGPITQFGHVHGVSDTILGADLAVLEDTGNPDGALIVMSRISTAGFTKFHNVNVIGEIFDRGTWPADASLAPYIGLGQAESESDSLGNDFVDWHISYCVDSTGDGRFSYENFNTSPPGLNVVPLNTSHTTTRQPDVDGNTVCQAFPVFSEQLGTYVGRIKPNLLRLGTQGELAVESVVTDASSGEEFYVAMDALYVGWNSTDIPSF